MKGKMLDIIKTNYTGQHIDIEFLSTKFINRLHNVPLLKDDYWGKDWVILGDISQPHNRHVNKNRILKIVTADGKIWKNSPEKPKWWCNNCGYKTTKPPRDYVCPKCLSQPQQYRRYVMLKKLGSQKF
jgi:predicted Zn-ribbon and HTH transcriptional regulator